jgi:hypothetical protein
MDIKQKLKYYIEIKEILPDFLLSNFNRMSIRQKMIFYNTLKDSLTDEQKNVLLNELNLDLTLIENSNKIVEEFRFILIGNIIGKHYYGENKEIKSGTKHFRAGAKVYLLPEYGGNGHTDIPVYGLPRKSRKKIHVVIRGSMIKNVRVKKTFDPKLIEKIDDSFFYDYFDNDETGLQGFADSMNENRKNNSIELADDAGNTSQ